MHLSLILLLLFQNQRSKKDLDLFSHTLICFVDVCIRKFTWAILYIMSLLMTIIFRMVCATDVIQIAATILYERTPHTHTHIRFRTFLNLIVCQHSMLILIYRAMLCAHIHVHRTYVTYNIRRSTVCVCSE